MQVLKMRVKSDSNSNYSHLYLCSCGKEFIAMQMNVNSGKTTSCGCVRRTKSSQRAPLMSKGNITHNKANSREYHTWEGMIQRCTNPKNPKFKTYGGLGITVCNSWRTFSNFFSDMGERPRNKTLDRINNDLGYYKENCRWATVSEQNLNKRKKA